MITLTEKGMSAFNGRGMAGKIKESYRYAFRRHRALYMARHFKRTARNHYGSGVYPARRKKTANRKRRKVNNKQTKKRVVRKTGNIVDRFGNIPLVKSGLLRHKVLHGGFRCVGSQSQMSMRFIGVPRYTYFNKPGQINKIAAIQEVARDEEKAFANNVETRLHKLIMRGE